MSINLTVGSDAPIPLNGLTDLENAIETNLSLGLDFAGQLDKPISTLPAGLSSTVIQYTSGNQSWKLEDFSFTLSGGVTGSLVVITAGNLPFSYTDGFATVMATGLSTSTNANASRSFPVPVATVFVCIALDFTIQGGISGTFTSGIYGVSGSAKTNDTFTVTFCKKCAPTDLLGGAIAEAFQDFVLPLHPLTANNLKAGDYIHYNFNANLQLGLGASIGIDKVLYAGQYKADIPDTANAITVNASIKLEAQAGAKLAFSFDYAGAFETLLWKDTDTSGHLHLYRSKAQDTKLGLNLGLTLNANPAASANVTTSQLGSSLSGLLPAPLAAAFNNSVWPKASPEIDKYVTDANNKVAGWLKPFDSAQATLDLAIEATNQNFLLLDYTFDTTAPAFADAWADAIGGKFLDAFETAGGGLSLSIGSGLESFYAQKTSVSLNLFGKLTAAWSSSIISNSSLIYAGHNIFHLITTEGRELLTQINNSKKEIDLYFAAELDLTSAAPVLGTTNLHFILQATSNQKFGNYIASFLVLTTTGPDNGNLAKRVQANAAVPNSSQFLHLIFGPRIYGQLSFSPIPKTASDDTSNDRKNYAKFAGACFDLRMPPPTNFSYVGQSDYDKWSKWSIACNDDWPAPVGAVADRSNSGDTLGSQAIAELHQAFPGQNAIAFSYTFEAARDFLNLCAGLHQLAQSAAVNLDDWNGFVSSLKAIIKNDVSPDFINPAVLAITRLCALGHPNPVVGPAPGLTDQNSIGVTMTYS